MTHSRKLFFILIAGFIPGAIHAQNSAKIEQHIQHVTSGLVSDIVLKGHENEKHTLSQRMKQLNVPGVSIAVIHNGRIEWARGFGVRNSAGAAVNSETLFQAGSISKPLAAMAALRLVQEGKLALDTDINKFLTTWKLPGDPAAQGKPVTLRELLTHTGGISVHGFPGYASGQPVPTLAQVLNGEKPANTPAIRSEEPPMKEWKYSGGGYTIMQQAVIDVTHEPFPKLLHHSVLGPIGMTRSTYEQPLPEPLRGNAATPYRADGKPVEGGAHTYPETAAAGLWTTPADIAKFAIEVERSLERKANHVLSADMTRQMLTPGLGNWGMGLEIGGSGSNPYFSHGGANEGFRNIFAAYENSGEGAVVMTNSDSGSQIGNEVMHSVAAEYGWPDWHPRVRTSIQVDPNILARYAGRYQLGPHDDLILMLDKGQLVAQHGQTKYPLYAEAATKFFALDSMPDVEFVTDHKGVVTGLVLHQAGLDIQAPRE